MDEYGYDDDDTANAKASKLLYKLYVHALDIVNSGEPDQEQVFDAILEAVPYFDNDTASIIYDFLVSGCDRLLNVSWHRLKWQNERYAQMGLWELYDRAANQHYDICYLSIETSRGRPISAINLQLCNDIRECNSKLRLLETGLPIAFDQVSMEESKEPIQQWCLGTCQSIVPNLLFSSKEYAILIGEVLEYHGLNPKLCHYIYIGVGVQVNSEEKFEIIDEFNKIYASNAKFRPNRPTIEDLLYDFSDQVTSGLL